MGRCFLSSSTSQRLWGIKVGAGGGGRSTDSGSKGGWWRMGRWAMICHPLGPQNLVLYIVWSKCPPFGSWAASEIKVHPVRDTSEKVTGSPNGATPLIPSHAESKNFSEHAYENYCPQRRLKLVLMIPQGFWRYTAYEICCLFYQVFSRRLHLFLSALIPQNESV